MNRMSVLVLLALGLSSCVPGAGPLPNPIPIVLPDGTLTARGGVLTLSNLESATMKDPSVYVAGPELVLLEPSRWGCTPYGKGWGCTKVPDLGKGLTLSLNYSGTITSGNVAYYVGAQLVVKSLNF